MRSRQVSPCPARSRRWATRASTPRSWCSTATPIDRPDPRRQPGRGFYQMMDGVEVGRVNVAARACGVSRRGFELGIAYAQQRETFGKKIAEHQAVLFRLAEMATKVEASHQMMVKAARLKDSGERNDLEAGMAKYLASEYCAEVVEDSFRIHGGYGYSKEYEIERLYREAPMLLIGEGTADIQRMIIGRQLLRVRRAVTGPRDPRSGLRYLGHEHAAQWLEPGPRPTVLEYPMSLGTFEKYEEAQKLVDTLADKEFPVQNCLIVGTDLKQLERITGRLTWGRVLLGGALSRVWLGLFVGLIFALFAPQGQRRPDRDRHGPVRRPVRAGVGGGHVCAHRRSA